MAEHINSYTEYNSGNCFSVFCAWHLLLFSATSNWTKKNVVFFFFQWREIVLCQTAKHTNAPAFQRNRRPLYLLLGLCTLSHHSPWCIRASQTTTTVNTFIHHTQIHMHTKRTRVAYRNIHYTQYTHTKRGLRRVCIGNV